jgi:hypothetical protein
MVAVASFLLFRIIHCKRSVSAARNLPERVFRVRFGLRQILTVFQFACAIALIILSFSINRQIRFMMGVDHGYRDSGLFVIFNPKGKDRRAGFSA